MVLVSLNAIEKSFGIKKILTQINLSIGSSDRIGIVGNNGAGKSTLFNIITGNTSIDEGQIFKAKDLRIAYLKQSNDANGNQNLYDYCLEVFKEAIEIEKNIRNIEKKLTTNPHSQELLSEYSLLIDNFNQIEGYAYHSKARGVLLGLGFSTDDFTRALDTLSGGQKTRLDLAKLLLSENDLLLLDEPTNHLDIDSVKWLENYLSNYKNSVAIISHDRYFLDRTINKVFEIEMTKGKQYTGNYSEYMKQKRLNYNYEMRAFEKNKQLIQKEEELIRRFKQTGTAKLAKRAKSRENKLERIEHVHKPFWLDKNLNLKFEMGLASGHNILTIEDLSKSFNHNKIFDNISFEVYKNDRIGLIGKNGIGKTTLFKILANLIHQDEGSYSRGHHVTQGYYDQEHQNISIENTLFEEIHNLMPQLGEEEVRNYLGSFLFHGDDVFKTIALLSGGEKARVSLLKLMLSEKNFLLLDEPTNHLDIISRETLENALLHFEGTFFAISHDRYFLNHVCNKIYEMTENGIIEYLGNYDDYLAKKNQMEILSKPFENGPLTTKTERKQIQKLTREQKKIERDHKNKLKEIELQIHEKEERQEVIHLLQCEEENYSNPSKMQALNEEIKTIEKFLEKAYEDWEKLI